MGTPGRCGCGKGRTPALAGGGTKGEGMAGTPGAAPAASRLITPISAPRRIVADESLRLIGGATWQQAAKVSSLAREVRFPIESPEMLNVVRYSPLKFPLYG